MLCGGVDNDERKRNRHARFSVGRRTVGIENSEFRTAKFQSNRTHFERHDSLSARSLDGVGSFRYEKYLTTANYVRGSSKRG